MDSKEFFQLIGEFAVEFENICRLMEDCAMHILEKEGLQNDSISKVLLANHTADPLKNMLRSLLAERLKTEDFKKVSDLAFSEIQQLIEKRNSIIHAKWIAPIDDEDWFPKKGFVLGHKLKTNKRGDATEYLKYSKVDFIGYIETCRRIQRIINLFYFLVAFPDALQKCFKVVENKLVLPNKFGEFET